MTVPAAAGSPTLRLPASTSAVDAVTAARTAVDDVLAARATAAGEQAQRRYATSGSAQYDYYVNGPGAIEIAQENALQACREQTGMTTAECLADAAAGNAS
ncbi:hypothetical protein WIS52_20880 [Pseudonocardia nematodicida]|uniref:DUF4189 domain-containing protein n=1 Tax=Pseudonocardia nematodicida TaxID=1206997 RepID=A0ABV1KEM7_9PSEU